MTIARLRRKRVRQRPSNEKELDELIRTSKVVVTLSARSNFGLASILVQGWWSTDEIICQAAQDDIPSRDTRLGTPLRCYRKNNSPDHWATDKREKNS